MGFQLSVNIPAATAFLQGLLSFLSPCVLPLLPVYIGYLSGGTMQRSAEGTLAPDRGKVILHTIFFVLGISFAFLLLGIGATAAGAFFSSRGTIFVRAGGILLILLGLFQTGLLKLPAALQREYRLPAGTGGNPGALRLAMSPLTAFVTGFTFSFAWTPCVGPTLTGILLMAASAATKARGFLLMGLYTLGFTVPFLVTGLFASAVLAFFRSHRSIVRYTEKAGGAILILMGILMLSGRLGALSGYLSAL